MDAKDFRLLAILSEDARQSFRSLGRRLSLSAPAIRERLRRLEGRGIVQGYWVSIDPTIFGREDVLVSFDKEWTRADAVRASEAPDVAWVAWKVDGGLTVELWPRDAKRGVETLARFLGRRPSWHGTAESGWTGKLSGLDWRILDSLIDTPLESIEDLSNSTGLSPKTVRSHLARLTQSEAIYVVARLGLPADSGVLVYNLVVSGRGPFAELKRVIGDTVLIHETKNQPRKYLFCRADSLGELTQTLENLRRLPGVESVQVSLNREMILQTEFVHRLVRERISGGARSRR
ncbi:MAG: winged helix-turn-helix transcriptional regulator [Methanobacteriota archaeon]|nr:MAG: winged helix-turn-helix transcriptional regulator [Euryarchaeota archaeon]